MTNHTNQVAIAPGKEASAWVPFSVAYEDFCRLHPQYGRHYSAFAVSRFLAAHYPTLEAAGAASKSGRHYLAHRDLIADAIADVLRSTSRETAAEEITTA